MVPDLNNLQIVSEEKNILKLRLDTKINLKLLPNVRIEDHFEYRIEGLIDKVNY
jgi:hypothetical protein